MITTINIMTNVRPNKKYAIPCWLIINNYSLFFLHPKDANKITNIPTTAITVKPTVATIDTSMESLLL
jgi:hypothetical protein